MASEYGEPFCRSVLTPSTIITPHGRISVAWSSTDGNANVLAEKVADRIVACINALSGIKDPSAVAEVLRLVGEWVKAATEHDESWADNNADFIAREEKSRREWVLRDALLAAARKMKGFT